MRFSHVGWPRPSHSVVEARTVFTEAPGATAVGARSYNQLMERLVELATAEEASSTAEEASSSAEARRPTHETEDASEEDAALRAALALSLDDDAGTKTPETPTSPTSRAVSAALGEIVAEVSAEASDDDLAVVFEECGLSKLQQSLLKQKLSARRGAGGGPERLVVVGVDRHLGGGVRHGGHRKEICVGGGEGICLGPVEGGPGVHRVERLHGRRDWISAGDVVNPGKAIQFKILSQGIRAGGLKLE